MLSAYTLVVRLYGLTGRNPHGNQKDPENNETPALFKIVNFSGQRVLEIGCGNGRVTWRYAGQAAHVTGIDPDDKQIALARETLP